jgi:hypothetical protein
VLQGLWKISYHPHGTHTIPSPQIGLSTGPLISFVRADRIHLQVYLTDNNTVFIIPFFIIKCLKLRRRQKIALCGVFSLGLITISISLARFIVYTVTDYSVDDASGSKCPCREPAQLHHFSARPTRVYSDTRLTTTRSLVHSRDVYSNDCCFAACPQSPHRSFESRKHFLSQHRRLHTGWYWEVSQQTRSIQSARSRWKDQRR